MYYQLQLWDEDNHTLLYHWWYSEKDIIYQQLIDTLAWLYKTLHRRWGQYNCVYVRNAITSYDQTSLTMHNSWISNGAKLITIYWII